MNKNRSERHDAIRSVVRRSTIRTQEELTLRLQDLGFDCTQTTVSRDMSEIGLHKLANGTYVLAGDDHLQHVVSDYMSACVVAGPFVVVTTLPGAASLMAGAIGAARLPSALCTFTGNDAVMVVCDGTEGAELLVDLLERLR